MCSHRLAPTTARWPPRPRTSTPHSRRRHHRAPAPGHDRLPGGRHVTSVSVKVGDTVTAGQTLAQLDTQSLAQTVDAATGDPATTGPADAVQRRSGQGTTSGGLGGTGGTGGTAAGAPTPRPDRAAVTPAATHSGVLLAVRTAGSRPGDAAAQQAVLAAQQQVDAAQGNATAALNKAASDCAGSPPPDLRLLSDLTAARRRRARSPAPRRRWLPLQEPRPAPQPGCLDTLDTLDTRGRQSRPRAAARAAGSARPAQGARRARRRPPPRICRPIKPRSIRPGQCRRRPTGPCPGHAHEPDQRNRRRGQPRRGASVTAGSSTENIVVQGSGGYQVSTTVASTTSPTSRSVRRPPSSPTAPTSR